jgi:hypothetical protein
MRFLSHNNMSERGIPHFPPRLNWYREPLIRLWAASQLDVRVLLAVSMTIEWVTLRAQRNILRDDTRRQMSNIANLLFLFGSLIFVIASLLNLLAGKQ